MRLRLLAGLLLAIAAPRLHAEPIRELVIFGDSHSDTGNGCTLFVPADTACVGLRYSNGPVWVEDLAWRLKVPQPVASALGGLNFAFGGARTGVGTSTLTGYRPPVPRIGTQVNDYLARQAPRNDQLFVLLAGHNDWAWSVTPPGAVLTKMANHISTLAEAGATQFLVSNLSLLGHAPILRGSSLAGAISQAIEQYNDLLATELDKLQSQYSVTINLVDLESLANQAISDPASLGLSNVINMANGPRVKHPDEYLYWDYIHFTRAVHRLLGQRAALALGFAPAYDADFDGNGFIDGRDLAAWTPGFGAASGATRAEGDSDGDQNVDGSDLLAWQRQRGLADPYATDGAVPEPAALWLVIVSLLVTVGQQRRRTRRRLIKGSAARTSSASC